MIISNLPINDDIAKKLIYKNDGGVTVEINAKDIATTTYVSDIVGDITALINNL